MNHDPSSRDQAHSPRRLTARDFHPQVLKLFDQYVHGAIDRRAFLERAARFAVAGTTATALLDSLNPKFAQATQVPASDPRLDVGHEDVDSPDGYGKVRVYRAHLLEPSRKLPVVLVVHENRGLNPHIEDVARRLALEGFLALAPDALFPLGGYPGDEDKARELFQKLDQTKTRADFLACAKAFESHPAGNGKLGVVGFCYGGGIAHFLSTRLSTLDAAVPFYGMAPPPEDAAKVHAPLLVHLAEHDERINSAWPAYEAALEAAHKKFQVFTYPGTEHGFNNDTTPRYDENAAKLAWERTIEFLRRTLGVGPGAASAARR